MTGGLTPVRLIGVAALAVAVIGGAIATTHYGLVLDILLAVVLGLVFVIARFGAGAAIGLLALGGLNALPGPNLQTTIVALTFTAQAVDVLVLIVVMLFMRPGRRGDHPRPSAVERRIAWWAVAFLVLWLIVVARTVVGTPVPIRRAVYWCMDFASFAALVPLFARTFRDKAVLRVFTVTVMIGALISSLAQSVVIISRGLLPFLVHTTTVASTAGLPRLYTGAIDLPFAALPLGLGAALFGTKPRYRLAGAVVTLVCLVSVALALTRARYIGMTVGVACAALVWLCLSDAAARLARIRFARAILAIAVTAGMLVLYHPSLLGSSELTAVTSRVNTATAVVTGASSTQTVDVRLVEAGRLTGYLGGQWLFGLGFLDPSSDYISTLPNGSIRNGDVGYLNMIMTMGVFGLVLYLAPLVLLVGAAVRRRVRRVRDPNVEWLLFGGVAYLIATLISSTTLVILFSTTGVVAAAAVVALLVQALSPPPVREPPPDEPRILARSLAGAA